MPDTAPLWGAWSVRRYTARQHYYCIECEHMILPGDNYWRRYGKMGEAFRPWTARMCERCEAIWRTRYAA